MATRLSDGRYQSRKRVGPDKRLVGLGNTPEEADADLERKVRAWESTPSTPEPDPDPATGPTVHWFAKTVWFPTLEFVEPLTREAYTSTYRSHVRPYLADVPLRDLDLRRCQAWVNDLASGGKRNSKGALTGEPLGAKKVREARELLGRLVRLARAEGYDAPTSIESVNVPKKPPKRVRVLSVSKALEISAATRGTRAHAPCVLAMVLGLRRGEIAGLRWDDLDRPGLRLTVYEQIIQPKGGARRSGVKSDAGRRILPLTTELVEIIDGCGNLDSRYIAGWKGEAWLPPDKITQDWESIRDGFGMPEWTMHDLRHGAASILYSLKVDLLTISKILGHSKVDMTLLYTDVHDDTVRAAMGEVARAFAKP